MSNTSTPNSSRKNSASNLESRNKIVYAEDKVASPLLSRRRSTAGSIRDIIPTRSLTPLGSFPGPDALNLSHALPNLNDMEDIEQFLSSEPSNIVQILPEISIHLQQMCIEDASICPLIWSALKPIFEMKDAAKNNARPSSPVCEAKTNVFKNYHDEECSDDYSWLNDKSNQQVLDYIDAENKYADKMLEDTLPLQKLLYKEFVSRLCENEESARVTLSDGWTYYSKYVIILTF